MDESAIILVVILYFIILIWYYMLLFMIEAASIFSYVMQSISMAALAKRRGIERPWLAWVPVANSWLLGSVSDQYRYRVTGEDRNLRKRLLIQRIICHAVAAVMVSALVLGYIGLVAVAIMESEALISVAIIVFYAVMLILLCAYVLVSVFYYITQYKALFDFYRSCDPKTSTLFFVLSFFSTVAITITVFLDRNKDLGMPPRAENPPVIEDPGT